MLETPCILIDNAKMERNIQRMADIAKRNGVHLRPHAKTHKIPSIAQRQIDAGAAGITVAKVSEAEVMAEHGIRDIFIAYPMVIDSKIERAIKVSEQINLILCVDSLEGARRLSELAERHNHTLKVRLEVDIGLKRSGVLYEDAVKLAYDIKSTYSHLEFCGIYSYCSSTIHGQATLDRRAAGHEEGRLMVALADKMRAEGIEVRDVSVGSTPTGEYAAEVKGVTEIRPGTYVFADRMIAQYGVCSLEECAATVLASVVSRPTPERMIIDGGSKTFATDVQPQVPPLNLRGFGYFVDHPDIVLERMNEEHGMVKIAASDDFKVGDTVQIIPNHICSTVNLHNKVYMVYPDRTEELTVMARGMLQ